MQINLSKRIPQNTIVELIINKLHSRPSKPAVFFAEIQTRCTNKLITVRAFVSWNRAIFGSFRTALVSEHTHVINVMNLRHQFILGPFFLAAATPLLH
jgi:hypothetical protein